MRAAVGAPICAKRGRFGPVLSSPRRSRRLERDVLRDPNECILFQAVRAFVTIKKSHTV